MEKPAHIICSEPVITHYRGLGAIGVVVGAAVESEGGWWLTYDEALDQTKTNVERMLESWIIDGKSPNEIKGGALSLENKKEWYVQVIDHPADYPHGYLVYCYKVAGPDTMPRDVRTRVTPERANEYKRQLAEELPKILQAPNLAKKIGAELSVDVVPLDSTEKNTLMVRLQRALNYEAREIYMKGRVGGRG